MTTFPSGSFRLSRIIYIEDLQRADSRVIPLGAIAEVTLPHLRGLAMAARTALDPDELALVGSLMRDHLAVPYDFLEGEFLHAWKEADKGEALNMLMQEHSSSLSFLAPNDLQVPRRWLIGESAALPPLVRNRLIGVVDDEFYEMILEDLLEGYELSEDFPPPPETLDKIAA